MELLMVYFMTAIFFLNTSLKNVPTFAARYIDNLGSLGHYAWVHAIHKWMMPDVPLIATHVHLRCKGKCTTTGYLT